MLTFLADTNLWLRFVDAGSPQHPSAVIALEELAAKTRLCLVPQNLVEFWVVSTRPKEANGLGWRTEQAAARLAELRDQFELKTDTPDLTDQWLTLVKEHKVQGKRAHDARIAAAALSHRVDFLVTFNLDDFRSWPLKTVHPADISKILSYSGHSEL